MTACSPTRRPTHFYLGSLIAVLGMLSNSVGAAEGNFLVPSPPTGPVATRIVVRVVAHGAMVLGQEVGGARVTITDVETGRLLASGIQQGDAGDQNQIMRTPHLMKEPIYTSLPSASFHTTLELEKPTLVEISAQGPLAYPSAMRRATKTVLLIPGQDLRSDGIILDLSGYIIQIEHPPPGESLIAKDDVKLLASVRTLSGAPVRPHGDWDSRKIRIWGEVMIGAQIVERLQMFYAGKKGKFEAPFFVPLQKEAPDGIRIRVVVADVDRGNFGLGEQVYPVLPEEVKFRDRK